MPFQAVHLPGHLGCAPAPAGALQGGQGTGARACCTTLLFCLRSLRLSSSNSASLRMGFLAEYASEASMKRCSVELRRRRAGVLVAPHCQLPGRCRRSLHEALHSSAELCRAGPALTAPRGKHSGGRCRQGHRDVAARRSLGAWKGRGAADACKPVRVAGQSRAVAGQVRPAEQALQRCPQAARHGRGRRRGLRRPQLQPAARGRPRRAGREGQGRTSARPPCCPPTAAPPSGCQTPRSTAAASRHSRTTAATG